MASSVGESSRSHSVTGTLGPRRMTLCPSTWPTYQRIERSLNYRVPESKVTRDLPGGVHQLGLG